MHARLLALALGLAVPALLVTWPGSNAAFFCLGLGGLCAISRRTRTLSALFIGLAIAFARVQHGLDARLPFSCEGLDMQMTGRVVGLPDERAGYQRFRFDVEHVSVPACRVARVELHSYRHLRLAGDQRWRFHVRLRRVHGFANPGGYDFEGDRWHRGILASGYVRNPAASVLLDEPVGLHAVRSHLREELRERVPHSPAGGIVRALAIGDREAIPASSWEVLNLTGTTHLAVISGLHVGMVSAALLGLGLAAARSLGPGLARWPAPVLATIPAFLGAVIYAALAGFSLPTQRALVMVCVGLVSMTRARRQPPISALTWALALVLLLDPLAPMARGFWLSFIAVGALIWMFTHWTDPRSNAWRRRAHRAWSAQLAVFVALFLPLLLFTQRAVLISPLANLLAIPVVGLVVVPMTLMGTCTLHVAPLVADVLLRGAEGLVAWLLAALAWMSRIAPAVTAGSLTLPMMFAIASVAATTLLPRAIRGRWWVVIVLLTLLAPHRNPPAEGEVRITTLDVGQGLAVIAETRQHTLLYDTGARFGPGADAGQMVVLPALRFLGIDGLDALIVSHADNDHAGGAASVLAGVPTRRVLVGSGSAARGLSASAERCRTGVGWAWNHVRFTLFRNPGASSENDRSCVLMIAARGGTALLPGDITAVTERVLPQPPGQVMLLLAPHHGSRSSSSAAFVAALAPRHVVFSAGYRNPFGHPDGTVVERYRRAGSAVHATYHEGGIIWSSSRPEELLGWRASHGRYWNRQF